MSGKNSWIYAFILTAALILGGIAMAAERTVEIAGFGARSGVVRSFGVNTEAVMRAAAAEINKSGGVRLGDGTMGKIKISFFDDRCNAEEGISVFRRIASSNDTRGRHPSSALALAFA